MSDNLKRCQLLLLEKMEFSIAKVVISTDISEVEKLEKCFEYMGKLEALRDIVMNKE